MALYDVLSCEKTGRMNEYYVSVDPKYAKISIIAFLIALTVYNKLNYDPI